MFNLNWVVKCQASQKCMVVFSLKHQCLQILLSISEKRLCRLQKQPCKKYIGQAVSKKKVPPFS
jgi:hypothetical protein